MYFFLGKFPDLSLLRQNEDKIMLYTKLLPKLKPVLRCYTLYLLRKCCTHNIQPDRNIQKATEGGVVQCAGPPQTSREPLVGEITCFSSELQEPERVERKVTAEMEKLKITR